ncbi:Hypothetical protein, putative [Bodo saltans]|uniref:Uncharacterized protein n=1 Tax=Bodo saltans TaxID=75058 RepID=A0A0S4J6D1_BODSA|nr:Hypothetical protein, putative [Bodo saltans]|eukprot:CUG84363.1 Hypothetical protein, putative [Bodo saltans]
MSQHLLRNAKGQWCVYIPCVLPRDGSLRHSHAVQLAASEHPALPYPELITTENAPVSEPREQFQPTLRVMFSLQNFDPFTCGPLDIVNRCIDDAFSAVPRNLRPTAVDWSAGESMTLVSVWFADPSGLAVAEFTNLMSGRYLQDRLGLWNDPSRRLLRIVARRYSLMSAAETNDALGSLPTAPLEFSPVLQIRR